jgi:hypothetical protein
MRGREKKDLLLGLIGLRSGPPWALSDLGSRKPFYLTASWVRSVLN